MNQEVWIALLHALNQLLQARVLILTVLPLLLMGVLVWLAAELWWAPALAVVQGWLQALWSSDWLSWAQPLNEWLAPLLLLGLTVPLGVLLILLLVSLALTPHLVALVARQRFAHLQALGRQGFVASLRWSLKAVLWALMWLLLSLPLWALPPLALLLPPFIWGWLTYRVMSFDALAEHARADEFAQLLAQHRWPLLGMGVLTGLMGALPGLVWLSGVWFVALILVLGPLAVWLYTGVFVLSSLWYANYCLAALARLRAPAPRPSDTPAFFH